MNRPYIICHMVMSIDGNVTGDFLFSPECEKATEVYYEINRQYKADGFICGRVTMEGSFTNGWYPDLSKYETVKLDPVPMNFWVDDMSGFYAIAFDPKGKLGWKSNKIVDPDGDPGYDGAQIIEVVTEQVDERYLAYLQEMEIPYIFAGETEIDVELALQILADHGINALILEGGSIVNGYFERADAIDELSLVVAPVIAGKEDKPLFMNAEVSNYELEEIKIFKENVVWTNYKRKGVTNSGVDRENILKIKWHKPIELEKALTTKKTEVQGLYYITRRIDGKIRSKETSLYLGIATKNNTIKNRLKAHKKGWLSNFNGKKYIRIGEITYPDYMDYRDNASVIADAESGLLCDPLHKKLFIANTDKRYTYSCDEFYTIINEGYHFELKKKVKMNENI